MAYSTYNVGRFFVVKGSQTPTADDIARTLEDVSARMKAVGQKLQYITFVDENVTIPPPEVRTIITKATRTILDKYVTAMHLIIPGEGVTKFMLRTAVRSSMIFGGNSDKVFIHQTTVDLAARLRRMGESSEDVEKVLDAIKFLLKNWEEGVRDARISG